MICKWCGAVIDEKKETCASCGRKNPPLSDCGGFYNLCKQKSDTQRLPVIPAQQPAPTPPAPKKHAAVLVLGIVSGVLLLLCIILLVLLLTSNRAAAPVLPVDDISPTLPDEKPSMPSELASETDSGATAPSGDDSSADPTESDTTPNPPEIQLDSISAEAENRFSLDLTTGEHDTNITSLMEDTCWETDDHSGALTDSIGNRVFTVSVEAKEDVPDAALAIVLNATVHNSTLAELYAQSGEVLWEYRTDESEDWNILKPEGSDAAADPDNEPSPLDGEFEVQDMLTLSEEEYRALFGEKQPSLFRCTLTGKNENGGSFHLAVIFSPSNASNPIQSIFPDPEP